jgi:rubrerythrin
MVGSFMPDEEPRRELKEIIEEEERHVRLFESYGEKKVRLAKLNQKS